MKDTKDAFEAGERVVWLYCTRGGYGYVLPVDATVIRTTAKRVRIEAKRTDGTTVVRSVKPENLRRPDARDASDRVRKIPSEGHVEHDEWMAL